MCEKLSKEALGGISLQHMKTLLIRQKEVIHLHTSSQQISPNGHIGVDLNDDNDDIEEKCLPSRPMGRDKAKAREKGKGKATSSNSPIGIERSTRSEEMMAQMIQLNTSLEKHMVETVPLT